MVETEPEISHTEAVFDNDGDIDHGESIATLRCPANHDLNEEVGTAAPEFSSKSSIMVARPDHDTADHTQKVSTITILVPPVPVSWKGVPVMETLDDEMMTYPMDEELDRQRPAKVSARGRSRGRPLGSRNRQTLNRANSKRNKQASDCS